MRTKNGSVRELIAGIRQAAEQEEYNPAEDLKTLQTQYKRLGKKDFGLMLDAMVEKYAAGEYAAIHAALVEKARSGDIEAINQIVRHYSGFIASRSMRPMKDEYGNTHMVVDETLRRRMETRLIAKILSFEIREPK